MARVVYSNIVSEARNRIVAMITDNVSDPITPSGQSRKWIYSRRPHMKKIGSVKYPIIIIPSVKLDNDEDKGSLDSRSKVITWECEIEILTSDNGYGNNNGNGLSHLDSISDSIFSTFMNKTNQTTLRQNSLPIVDIDMGDSDLDEISDEIVYTKTITLTFKNRMKVSA